MQRIDKPTIYRLYSVLERISCGLSAVQKVEKKGFIGQSQQNCFVHVIHFIEPSSEFRPNRPKIASLQNLIILEYETAFSWSTATSL
jgi:hypothetical protein